MSGLGVSWQQLTAAEPRLAELECQVREAAQAGRGKRRYCANSDWYGRFKPQLVELIGDRRGYPPGFPDYEPPGGWPADGLRRINLNDPAWWAWGDAKRASRYPATTAMEEILRGHVAYDVAYDHLYGLLPDCRHEGWCWG